MSSRNEQIEAAARAVVDDAVWGKHPDESVEGYAPAVHEEVMQALEDALALPPDPAPRESEAIALRAVIEQMDNGDAPGHALRWLDTKAWAESRLRHCAATLADGGEVNDGD